MQYYGISSAKKASDKKADQKAVEYVRQTVSHKVLLRHQWKQTTTSW